MSCAIYLMPLFEFVYTHCFLLFLFVCRLVRFVYMCILVVGQPQRSHAKLSGRGYPGSIFQHPKSRATKYPVSPASRAREASVTAERIWQKNRIWFCLFWIGLMYWIGHTQNESDKSHESDPDTLILAICENRALSLNRAAFLILAIGQKFQTWLSYLFNRIGLIWKNLAQLLNLTWINTLHISLAKRPQVSDSKKTVLSDSMQKSGSKSHRNYRASNSNTRLTTSDLVHTPAKLTIGQSGARLSDSLTSAQLEKTWWLEKK